MKKQLLLLCMLLITLLASAQSVKTVAIPEVVDKEGKLSYSQKALLRSTMARAITNREGYEAYDRTDVDAIMSEHEFQRTGYVSNEQIKRLGAMTGVSYILITEGIPTGSNQLFVSARIIDIVTGKVEMMDNITMGTSSDEMQQGCNALIRKMIGASSSDIEYRKRHDANALVASLFIPGLGQMIKYHYLEGGLTLGCEAALIGAGVGTYLAAKKKTTIMNSYNIDYDTYQSAANSKKALQGTSFAFFGLAVALYGVNLWRAYTLKPKKRSYAFYPTIIPTDDNTNFAFGMGATIKF